MIQCRLRRGPRQLYINTKSVLLSFFFCIKHFKISPPRTAESKPSTRPMLTSRIVLERFNSYFASTEGFLTFKLRQKSICAIIIINSPHLLLGEKNIITQSMPPRKKQRRLLVYFPILDILIFYLFSQLKGSYKLKHYLPS